MFVNIGQLTLVPPTRPTRKPKKKVTPSSPSQVSGIITNGSHATTNSDQFQTDLVSQTESELSFGTDDITSADTAPLVDLQVNDRVIWPSDNGYEKAVVKWIGTIPDDDSLQGEILVGVEFVSILGAHFWCICLRSEEAYRYHILVLRYVIYSPAVDHTVSFMIFPPAFKD